MIITNVEISDKIHMSGGYNAHTCYQLKVSSKSVAWVVYRRYSQFEGLHRQLAKVFGQQWLADHQIVFPVKIYGGSLLGTMESVVKERMMLLQNYMTSLVKSSEEVTQATSVVQFLDMVNHGVSGTEIALGPSNILAQTFARVAMYQHIKGFWKLRFVVLLVNGELLIMNNIYDQLPAHTFNLTAKANELKLTPKAHHNSILITTTNVASSSSSSSSSSDSKVVISFGSTQEAAYWIRCVAEFTTALPTTTKSSSSSRIVVTKQHYRQVLGATGDISSSSSEVDSSSFSSFSSDKKKKSGIFRSMLLSSSPKSHQGSSSAASKDHDHHHQALVHRAEGTGNTADYLSNVAGI